MLSCVCVEAGSEPAIPHQCERDSQTPPKGRFGYSNVR
jgi:hypothetical protein